MKPLFKYSTLGSGHAINDCIAGFIIGSLFNRDYSPLELGIYTLLYNVLAFGGQLVFAKITEAYFDPRRYLIGSFLFLAASLLFLPVSAQAAILLSGIASAVFHVTGGLEATREDDKAYGIGIFASPGVVGLVIGGLLAYLQLDFIVAGIILCMAYAGFIHFFYKPGTGLLTNAPQSRQIETHDIIMVVLITAISLRSFVWDVIQMIRQDRYDWLMVIAIAAMCGKISGGFLADRIGHRKYSVVALLLSIPFLALMKKTLLTLSIGVFLLQSTIPSTTVMILQAIRRKPALAVSMSFGLSILVAITLFYTPAVKCLNNNISIFLVLIASVVLIAVSKKFRRGYHR